jgi:solute carrier family 35 (GDP-fucose transporter), member C1
MLKNVEIFGVVCFYTTAAITSIIVNKHYLNSVSVPLIFLLLQMIVSSGALMLGYSILHAGERVLKKKTVDKPMKKSLKIIIKTLWPMVVCNVFGLAFNIICLSKMDAIMHQVTRGITLPLTALVGPLLGNNSGGWRVFLVCFAIFSGFIVAVSGEMNSSSISLLGIAAGLFSSLIAAYNAQFVKNRFDTTAFSALDLVFYNNLFSTLLLAPIALTFEARQLVEVSNWGHVAVAAVITGLIGVVINYAGFLQIKVTSAVTHCVSSAARGVLQVAASCLFLQEKLSITRTIGIGVSLLASSLYPIVKTYDNRIQRKSKIHHEENTTKMTSVETKNSNGYHEIPEIEVDEVIFNKIQLSGTSK